MAKKRSKREDDDEIPTRRPTSGAKDDPDAAPADDERRGKKHSPDAKPRLARRVGLLNKYKPPTAGVGRPLMLTDDLIKEFALLLPRCAYVETVADMLGVTRHTLRRWRLKARELYVKICNDDTFTLDPKDEVYIKFYTVLKWGLAQLEARCLGRILKDPSWQSDAWVLERRFTKWSQNKQEIRELKKGLDELKTMLEKSDAATRGE